MGATTTEVNQTFDRFLKQPAAEASTRPVKQSRAAFCLEVQLPKWVLAALPHKGLGQYSGQLAVHGPSDAQSERHA